MPDINDAMNGMGAGDMSQQDFINAITASINGPVGTPTKYGNEKTEAQKQAEKQLAEMEKLTEGLEELNETLKKIQNLADETKKKKEVGGSGNFGDVTGAMNKIFNTPGKNKDLSPLEQSSLSKLEKLAEAGLMNHSVGVKDTVLHDLMRGLMQVISEFASKIKEPELAKSQSSNATDTPEKSNLQPPKPTGRVGGLSEGPPIVKSESGGLLGAKALEEQNKEVDRADEILKELNKDISIFAKKFNVTEETIKRMLEKLKGQSEEVLINAQQALKQPKSRKKYDPLISSALTLDKQVRMQKSEEDTANAAEKFAHEVLKAGEELDKNNSTLKKTAEWLQNAGTLASKLNPNQLFGGHQYEIGITKPFQQAAKYMEDAGQMTYAVGGPVGDITQNKGSRQYEILNEFDKANDDAIELGVNVQKVRDVMNKGFRKGITTDFREIAHIGIGLARQIGSDVDSTSDELQNWIQKFQLSNMQARTLVQNVKQVGNVTGVTGDNLLRAVKSAAQLADNMRSAGNFTLEANRQLIQMSAVAQKLGIEKVINPIQEGLQNFNNFQKMSMGMRGFLTNAGVRGGVNPGDIMMGEGLNEKNLPKLINGLQQIANQYRSTDPKTQQIFNSILSRMTEGMINGIGDLDLAIKGLRQGSEKPEQTIERLEKEKSENWNATQAEKKAYDDQIKMATKKGMTDTIDKVIGKMGEKGTIQKGLKDAGVDEATLIKSIKDLAERAGVSKINERGIKADNIEQIIQKALSSGSNLREVIDIIQQAQQKKDDEDRGKTDPATKLQNYLNAMQINGDRIVENLSKETLENTPPWVIAESIRMIKIVELVGNAVSQLNVIIGLLTALNAASLFKGVGGMLGLGGGVGGGVGGALGTAGSWAGGAARGIGMAGAALAPAALTAAAVTAAAAATTYVTAKWGAWATDNAELRQAAMEHIAAADKDKENFNKAIPEIKKTLEKATDAELLALEQRQKDDLEILKKEKMDIEKRNKEFGTQVKTQGQNILNFLSLNGYKGANQEVIDAINKRFEQNENMLKTQLNLIEQQKVIQEANKQTEGMNANQKNALDNKTGINPSNLTIDDQLNNYYKNVDPDTLRNEYEKKLFITGQYERQKNETDIGYAARKRFGFMPEETSQLNTKELFGANFDKYKQLDKDLSNAKDDHESWAASVKWQRENPNTDKNIVNKILEKHGRNPSLFSSEFGVVAPGDTGALSPQRLEYKRNMGKDIAKRVDSLAPEKEENIINAEEKMGGMKNILKMPKLDEWYKKHNSEAENNTTNQKLFLIGHADRQENETDLMYAARRQYMLSANKLGMINKPNELFGPQQELYKKINELFWKGNYIGGKKLIEDNKDKLDPNIISVIVSNYGLSKYLQIEEPVDAGGNWGDQTKLIEENKRRKAALKAPKLEDLPPVKDIPPAPIKTDTRPAPFWNNGIDDSKFGIPTKTKPPITKPKPATENMEVNGPPGPAGMIGKMNYTDTGTTGTDNQLGKYTKVKLPDGNEAYKTEDGKIYKVLKSSGNTKRYREYDPTADRWLPPKTKIKGAETEVAPEDQAAIDRIKMQSMPSDFEKAPMPKVLSKSGIETTTKPNNEILDVLNKILNALIKPPASGTEAKPPTVPEPPGADKTGKTTEIPSPVGTNSASVPNQVALVRPDNNEAMMQNRIQTEFAGDSTSGPAAKANEHLDQLNDYNRQQVEMMKQELELLRSILNRLTGSQQSGAARGNTSPNSRPSPPAQYYEWAVRPTSNSNFGGVENYPRV